MTVLTDTGRRVGCYIVGEGAGADGGPGYSREIATFKSGSKYQPGQVVSKVTASGKFAAITESANDGTQTVAGICYGFYDATAADVEGVITKRRSTVNGHELIWPGSYDDADKAAGIAALAALGIVVRF